MTGAAAVRELVAGSRPADWIAFPEMGTWTCRDDVALRIVRHEQLDGGFRAPWTEPIQGNCESYGYIVYYDSSPVEYHTIVGVDDFRAHVPLPREPAGPNQPYTVSAYEATVARVVTGDAETFNAYLNQTGIEIRE